MCTKLSSWSISSTLLPEPEASGAIADSGFGGSPRSAWNSAAALTWHSRSSAAGSESNRQVAPTRTSARPSFILMVRMVRPVLMLPSKFTAPIAPAYQRRDERSLSSTNCMAHNFVEDNERSSRRWYAGAIGAVNFDGSINTGLTIRTIRMKDGLAEVRVGATCLFDSDPAAEDRECQVKAAALFQALRGDAPKPLSTFAPDATGSGRKVLLIDHDDSFVHMMAVYFRQAGASVTVVRHVHAQEMLKKNWDLLV